MRNCCILIPAYEPNDALLELIKKIVENLIGSQINILIVNDGSTSPKAKLIFKSITQAYNDIDIVELKENLGKGEAIKIGLKYIDNKMPHVDWIVTADADGQHLAQDILKVSRAYWDSDKPVLGVRHFDTEVPFRSKIGNSISRLLFNWLYGTAIIDTQTGLRGFNRELIPDLLKIKVGRYAFELQALIKFVKLGEVRQVPITTVYEPNNPSSHFRPILDSLHIYWVFLRHVMISSLAMILEIMVFSTLTMFGFTILVSLTTARTLSGILHFYISRSFVFKNESNYHKQLIKYFILITIHLFSTLAIVTWLTDRTFTNPILSLLVAYLIFFILSFVVQRSLVFAKKK